MRQTATLTAKRRPEEVFEAMADLEKLAFLSEGKVRVSPVDGRPARGKGSAVRIAAEGIPGGGDVLCETLDWDPPRRCVRRFDIPDLPTTLSVTVEPDPAGCRITVDVEVEPKSFLYKMMLPALERRIEAQKARAVSELERRLA